VDDTLQHDRVTGHRQGHIVGRANRIAHLVEVAPVVLLHAQLRHHHAQRVGAGHAGVHHQHQAGVAGHNPVGIDDAVAVAIVDRAVATDERALHDTVPHAVVDGAVTTDDHRVRNALAHCVGRGAGAASFVGLADTVHFGRAGAALDIRHRAVG